MLKFHKLIVSFALAVVPICGFAAELAPPPLLVKIVLSAVSFDHSIDDRFGDVVNIGVVGDSARAMDIVKTLNKFSSKKIKGKPLEVAVLSGPEIRNGTVDVVFFAEPLDHDAASWAADCAEGKVTCVSAAEPGLVAGMSLGVEITDAGKPRLMINLEAAKATGAKFSGQILKLARIIQ